MGKRSLSRIILISAATVLLYGFFVDAQEPQKISYQAVIRNSSGQLVISRPIGMQISILQGSPDGSVAYVERHFPVTGDNGIINIEIGGGIIISGSFPAIDWSAAKYFIKTETDLDGGINYTITSTSQILSVPYIIYVQKDDVAYKNREAGYRGDAVCNASNEGVMRYNASNRRVEYCNGKEWVALEEGDSENALILTTAAAGSVTSNSAVSGGNITSDGGYPVSKRGVCWSTKQNPTIANNKSKNGAGTGTFTAQLANLSPGTTYWIRAYAINSQGITYGEQVHFSTPNERKTFTDHRDGNIYSWVRIGKQIWMAENLAYLPAVRPWTYDSSTDPYYYVYGYNGFDVNEAKATIHYQTSGVLYNWSAAMYRATSSDSNPSGVQGVCPAGWHLPSDAEWKELEIFLGMSRAEANGMGFRGSNQGTQLKDTTGWREGNGTNTSGFTARPGGFRDIYGRSLGNVDVAGCWWSATENHPDTSWGRLLESERETTGRNDYSKLYSGFSVRCIKD